MKWATVQDHIGRQDYGIIIEHGKAFLSLPELARHMNTTEHFPETLLEAMQLGDQLLELAKNLVEEGKRTGIIDEIKVPLEKRQLLAPIPRTRKNIFCVGKNYREHVKEMGPSDPIPEHVMIFTKPPTSIIGTDAAIPLHANVTDALDYEGELAIVIGKKGKEIPPEESLDYVFGYTILNDISARDLQKRHKQFFLGKSLDGSCPLGPWIVDKTEITDPHALRIETRVNGELRQNGHTSEMIFSIPEIIATLSRGMTLEPGDIIATGTPAGVGKGFNPPKYLQSGDIIEITIEKIGTLRNTVQ